MSSVAAVHQRQVARRVHVWMQRLQWIDQYAGDVLAPAQHIKQLFGHVLQCVGLVCWDRIADARLHIAPPTVIAAAESHQMRPAGVVAGKPHSLHHRLGTGHMERHLVEARNPLQPSHIVGDNRMVGAEHGTDSWTRCAPLSTHFL